MSVVERIQEIRAEIEKTRELLAKNRGFYRAFKDKDFAVLGESTASAMVLSQVFTDYYTCIETLFLRISQFFENSLNKDQWHKDLLHKMTLDIKDVRAAVISDETFSHLDEILRFRHFRRYYFEFDYDWDRIELVEKKYQKAHALLLKDLESFSVFLNDLAHPAE